VNRSHGQVRMTMTNTKVRTQTKECTASNHTRNCYASGSWLPQAANRSIN